MPTIHLTDGQTRALLEHGRFGTYPSTLGGKARIALGRAVAKLENAVEDIEYGEFKADLGKLTAVLLDVKRRRLVDAVHGRIRDLQHLTTLWIAAEMLPEERHAILDVNRLADPAWPNEVLDLLDQHGIEVELPGDELGDGGPGE